MRSTRGRQTRSPQESGEKKHRQQNAQENGDVESRQDELDHVHVLEDAEVEVVPSLHDGHGLRCSSDPESDDEQGERDATGQAPASSTSVDDPQEKDRDGAPEDRCLVFRREQDAEVSRIGFVDLEVQHQHQR